MRKQGNIFISTNENIKRFLKPNSNGCSPSARNMIEVKP